MVTSQLPKEEGFADEVLVSALESFDASVAQFQRYQQALSHNPDCYQTRQLVLREVHRHQSAQVSLEDFAAQHGPLQLSVSVEGLVERWLEIRKKVIRRLMEGLGSENKRLQRKKAVAVMRARAARFKASTTTVKSQKLTLGRDAQDLAVAGRLPTIASQALANDIRGLTEITQKYIPEAIDFSKRAQNALTGILNGKREDTQRRLEEAAARSHPMLKISKPLREGTQLVGGTYVTMKLRVADDTLDEIRAMASVKPPRLKHKRFKKVDADSTLPVSQVEVNALIGCLEKYADLMEKTNTDIIKIITTMDYNKPPPPKNSTPNPRMEHEGIRALQKLVNSSTMQAMQIVPDVFNHIRKNAKLIIGLLDKILKTDEL